jgi:hypothetical protein
MDDESTKLLREIRDLMVESANQDAAWREEMRLRLARSRRGWIIGIPVIVIGLLIIWSELTIKSPPHSQLPVSASPIKVQGQR